ncbi:MAG: endonuclease/exonuclease/phosphatase family protein [Kofleriaceae bacterium]
MSLVSLFVLAAIVMVPVAAGAAPHVRLMTYNLNYGNPTPKVSMDAIANADCDIVVLQEISEAWRTALRDRFGKQYPHHAYRLHGHGGGQAVLSKLPLTSEEAWAPLQGAGWFPARRIVVASPLGPLQILNVHLRPARDDGSWIKGFTSTPPLRKKEIEAHWKLMDRTLPTIVAGDFNEDDTGLAVDFLQHAGLVRVPTTGPRTWHYEVEVNGKISDLLKMDIDHVMIDGHLVGSEAKVLDAGTSDHRPVIVTIARK